MNNKNLKEKLYSIIVEKKIWKKKKKKEIKKREKEKLFIRGLDLAKHEKKIKPLDFILTVDNFLPEMYVDVFKDCYNKNVTSVRKNKLDLKDVFKKITNNCKGRYDRLEILRTSLELYKELINNSVKKYLTSLPREFLVGSSSGSGRQQGSESGRNLKGMPRFSGSRKCCIYSGNILDRNPWESSGIISYVIFLDSGLNLLFKDNNKVIKSLPGKLVIFPCHFIYSNLIFNQNKKLFIFNDINIDI